MAAGVDLEDLVEDMKAELTVPGTSSYATATTAQWIAKLRNAFWEARLDKVITGYDEEDGTITPTTGDTPLARELQQIIIFYAGLNVVKNRLMDLKTSFRAKAGQAEFERQQSTQALVALYKELVAKKKMLLEVYSESQTNASGYYIDGVMARDYSTYWWNLGSGDGVY